MRDLAGRVAVVTGGASGVGRAMAERFGGRGHARGAGRRRGAGAGRHGGRAASGRARGHRRADRRHRLRLGRGVARPRPAAPSAPSTCCATTPGSAAGAEGHMWEHDLNDWRWAFDVNVWGVIHGIKAFVPSMLADGEPGHVVNTSSGNGGVVAAARDAGLRHHQGRGGDHHRVPLGAAAARSTRPSARRCCSPGPKMLRTGLFESWRNRPASYANRRCRAATAADHASSPSRSAWPTAGDRARLHAGRGGGRPRRRGRAGRAVLDPAPSDRPTSRSGPAPRRCSTAPTPPTSAT